MKEWLEKSWVRVVLTALSLGSMVAFAVAFHFGVFANTSLRLDEAQSLFQINRDVSGMLYLIAQDVHVPLYHILLHFWQLLFGSDIVIARVMSLMFFIGTIVATYWLAVYAFGRRSIGLFAALLVTISPFMNWYGAETRMYTMLAFLTVMHALFFLKAMRTARPLFYMLWTVTAILGVYTHYFFAFVLVAELVAYLILRRNFVDRKSLVKFIIGGLVAVAAMAPWLLYVLSLGFASNTQPALMQPSAGDIFDTYAQFMFGFQVDSVNTIIISLWPVAVLLAFFGLQKSHRKVPPEATVFVLLATLPVVAAFIISITVTPFYLSRYLIVALPPLFIFISWLLSRYRPLIAHAIRIGMILVIGLLFVIQVASPNTPVKEDYKDAVAYLNERAASTDVIVLSAPFTVYPVEYYYDGPAKLTTQPIWDRFSSGSVPPYDEAMVEAETRRNVEPYQKAWLMLSYDQGYNDKLKEYYDNHFERLAEERFSPGLVIYEYRIRYDDPISLSDS